MQTHSRDRYIHTRCPNKPILFVQTNLSLIQGTQTSKLRGHEVRQETYLRLLLCKQQRSCAHTGVGKQAQRGKGYHTTHTCHSNRTQQSHLPSDEIDVFLALLDDEFCSWKFVVIISVPVGETISSTLVYMLCNVAPHAE